VAADPLEVHPESFTRGEPRLAAGRPRHAACWTALGLPPDAFASEAHAELEAAGRAEPSYLGGAVTARPEPSQ
jgi:hypothetical protein